MRVEQNLWDKSDLVRRLCRVLDTAGQVIRQLAKDGFTDPEEPRNNVRPEKVIAETALLLLACSTVDSHEEVNLRLRQLAELLAPHARSERMMLGMCLQPALALDYAHAHILLEKLGYPDERFESLLCEAFKSQAFAGRERAPHRELEQEWATRLRSASPENAKPRERQIVQNSALNRTMDLLSGTRDDVYAFTHALMYVRNFNLQSLPLPRSTIAILAEAEATLARCLDEEDYDLAGEVLLSWPLTGGRWSAAATFGFHVLRQVEDAAGFLPAPSTRVERLQKLEGEQHTNYFLATAYHTIYVMGLLCAAALQPKRTPPATVRTAVAVPGTARVILSFLDDRGRVPHWRIEFDKLSGAKQDALAGLLLNIAVRRKASQRDFRSLRELLIVADRLGLADMPAIIQTAELLGRLALFAEITKALTNGDISGDQEVESPQYCPRPSQEINATQF